MRIFISHSSIDIELVNGINKHLTSLGHETFIASENVEFGQDLNSAIKKNIEKSDVFIPILTENSIKSQWVSYEFGVFSEYVNQNKNRKMIIPVVIGDINLPNIFSNILYLKVENDEFNLLIERIQNAISQFEGRKLATEEKAEKLRETIEVSASDYIQETIITLEKKEKEFKSEANRWYALGYIVLILGVVIAIYITLKGIQAKGDWADVTLLSVKAGLIILLLLSSSKYSFNLGKTYMNESLKNSDRIHAISFGKFYLQVFGNTIDKNDIKEVFREWNLEKKSGFSDLKADDYDPKLIEIIIKTIETIKK